MRWYHLLELELELELGQQNTFNLMEDGGSELWVDIDAIWFDLIFGDVKFWWRAATRRFFDPHFEMKYTCQWVDECQRLDIGFSMIRSDAPFQANLIFERGRDGYGYGI